MCSTPSHVEVRGKGMRCGASICAGWGWREEAAPRARDCEAESRMWSRGLGRVRWDDIGHSQLSKSSVEMDCAADLRLTTTTVLRGPGRHVPDNETVSYLDVQDDATWFLGVGGAWRHGQ